MVTNENEMRQICIQEIENEKQKEIIENISKKNSDLKQLYQNINSAIQNINMLQIQLKQDSTCRSTKNILADYLTILQQASDNLIIKYDERSYQRQEQLIDLIDFTTVLNILQEECLSNDIPKTLIPLQDLSKKSIDLQQQLESDENSFQNFQNNVLLILKSMVYVKNEYINQQIQELHSQNFMNEYDQSELKRAQQEQNEYKKIQYQFHLEILKKKENINYYTNLEQLLENEVALISKNIKLNNDLLFKNINMQQDSKITFYDKLYQSSTLIDEQINALKLEQLNIKGETLIKRKQNLQSQIKDIHFIYVIDGSESMIPKFSLCLSAIEQCLIFIPQQFSIPTQETLHTILQFSKICQSVQPYGLQGDQININLIEQMKLESNYNSAFIEIENVIQQCEYNDKDQQYIILFFTDGGSTDKYDPSNLINLKCQLQNRFQFFAISFHKVSLIDSVVLQINQQQNMDLGNGYIMPYFFQIQYLSQIMQSFTNVSINIHNQRTKLQIQKEKLEKDIQESNQQIQEEEQELSKLLVKQSSIRQMIYEYNTNKNSKKADEIQVSFFRDLIEEDEKKITQLYKEILKYKSNLIDNEEELKKKQALFDKNQNKIKKLEDEMKEIFLKIQLSKNENSDILKILYALRQNCIDLINNIIDYQYLITFQKRYVRIILASAKETADVTSLIVNTADDKRRGQLVYTLQKKIIKNNGVNVFEHILKSKDKSFYSQIQEEIPNLKDYFNYFYLQKDEIFKIFVESEDETKRKQELNQILNKKIEQYAKNKEIYVNNKKPVFKIDKAMEILEHLLCALDLQSKLFGYLLNKTFINCNFIRQKICKENYYNLYNKIPSFMDNQKK